MQLVDQKYSEYETDKTHFTVNVGEFSIVVQNSDILGISVSIYPRFNEDASPLDTASAFIESLRDTDDEEGSGI